MFILRSLVVQVLALIRPISTGLALSTYQEISGEYEPLFLIKNDKTYEFADNITHDLENVYSISPPDNHDLYFACEAPDRPKLEKYHDALEAEVVEDPPITLSAIHCGELVQPITLKMDTKDMNLPKNVSQYKIGFLIYDKDGTFPRQTGFEGLPKQYYMLPVLSINIDTELPRVLSVSHTIYAGHLLQVNPSAPQDITFESNSDIFGINIDELYLPEKQVKVFEKQFPTYRHVYVATGNYAFKKIQLAPVHDFVLPNLAKTTFVNLNTAPMWTRVWFQWLEMEKFVRKVAKILKKLIVGTGTAKILKLARFDKNGNQSNHFMPVYLSANEQKTDLKFPIPKYFYKAIGYAEYDQNGNVLSNKGILIIALNSQNEETEDSKPICNDISNELGWMIANDYILTGQIYSCELNKDNMMNLGVNMATKYDKFNLREMKSPKNNNISIYDEIKTEYSAKTLAKNLSRNTSVKVKQMIGL